MNGNILEVKSHHKIDKSLFDRSRKVNLFLLQARLRQSEIESKITNFREAKGNSENSNLDSKISKLSKHSQIVQRKLDRLKSNLGNLIRERNFTTEKLPMLLHTMVKEANKCESKNVFINC